MGFCLLWKERGAGCSHILDLRVDWGFSHPQLPLAPQSGGRKVTDYVKSSLCGSGFSSWVVSFHQPQMAPAPKRTVLLPANLILCHGRGRKREVRKESKKGRKEKEGGEEEKRERRNEREREGERRGGRRKEREKGGRGGKEREGTSKAGSVHMKGRLICCSFLAWVITSIQ